jgi:hypothetical protein
MTLSISHVRQTGEISQGWNFCFKHERGIRA